LEERHRKREAYWWGMSRHIMTQILMIADGVDVAGHALILGNN